MQWRFSSSQPVQKSCDQIARFTKYWKFIVDLTHIIAALTEICLLINDRRVASVVAVSFCATYSLHVEDFNVILSEHPVMRETLERVAAARLSSIGGFVSLSC